MSECEQFRPGKCKIVMVRDRGLDGGLVKTASRPKVLTEYLTPPFLRKTTALGRV